MKETVEAKLNFFQRMNSIRTKHLDLMFDLFPGILVLPFKGEIVLLYCNTI